MFTVKNLILMPLNLKFRLYSYVSQVQKIFKYHGIIIIKHIYYVLPHLLYLGTLKIEVGTNQSKRIKLNRDVFCKSKCIVG